MSDTETVTDSEMNTPPTQDSLTHTNSLTGKNTPSQRNPYSSHKANRRRKRKNTAHNPQQQPHHHTRKSLQMWLHFARRGITDGDQHPGTSSHPQNTTPAENIIHHEHWGDTVQHEKTPGTIRILSRNVDTLSISDDCLAWEAAAKALQEYQVDIACFQETNVNWNPAILHRIRQILLAVSPQRAKIVVSQSKEPSLANYKPGGTSTIVLGPRTTHARMDGQDSQGLGRWSYLEFEGSNDR